MGSTTRMFDIKARTQKMTAIHKATTVRAKLVELKTGIAPPVFNLEKAITAMWNAHKRRYGLFNKYKKPHQGAQECARRKAQRMHGHDLSDPLTRARFAA